MTIIDLEQLLKPISEELPSGENLEYDSDFMELIRIAQGSPEMQMGDEHISAEEPNWRDIKSKCLELSQKTRSLEVIMLLSKALLRLEGLAGLSEGLDLLLRSLENYWDTIYPQLDPDDDNHQTVFYDEKLAFARINKDIFTKYPGLMKKLDSVIGSSNSVEEKVNILLICLQHLKQILRKLIG